MKMKTCFSISPIDGLAITHGKFGYSLATRVSARRFEYV